MTAWTIARREFRGGLRNFRIFLACLALGVAAIAAVGSVRTAVQTGLSEQATTLLGGDAEMRFTYRFASDEERDWMAQNAIETSEIVDFRSMAVIERDGQTERALAQVKGVDDLYPLYGTVGLEPELPLSSALEMSQRPGAVMDQVLIDRLGLQLGDVFKLGAQEFELRAALTNEPDSAEASFSLGPRIIVLRAALANSGLIADGTLYGSSYRLKVDEAASINRLKSDAKSRFDDTGLRWRDRSNGTPGISSFVDRIGSFLVLVGLAGLAVGGIGVSAAVRTYLDGKTETIAILKTLGATGRTIFAVYFIQIGLLAALGIAIGLLIGTGIPALLGPFLAKNLPVPALFSIYARPVFEAALYGALTAIIFTLWPLARARDIRAAGLFRDVAAPETHLPRWPYLLVVLALLALLVGSAAALSGLMFLTIWSAAGILAALILLYLASLLTRVLARRLARSRLVEGRPVLRLALGAIGGPGGESSAVILSLGLGLSVLATVGQIDANMRTIFTGDLPDIAPAYFVVDIQNDQLPGFLETANAQPGVTQIDTAAMLRGVITRINTTAASDFAGHSWVLHGDRGVSYADTPPDGTELTDGTWWAPDYTGPPLVSFAAEEGEELGLKIGDKLTVNILGRDITAEIANFRTVDFGTMGINFIMIMNSAALAGAPHSNIATLYADADAEAPLLRAIASKYPNITAIRTRDAIERVADTLRSLATATSWGAGVTLLTGFMVLIGAAAAGERRRVFEAAVLKTLGAVRGRILASFALRSAVLGAAAGLVAIFTGTVASWAVMTFVMEADFTFEPVSAISIVTGGALASLLAGLAFAIRPLSASPSGVLRAKE